MANEVTPWFSGGVKPLADRPGEYEREYLFAVPVTLIDYWSGTAWFYQDGGRRSREQQLRWRGLAQPSKGSGHER